MKFGDYDLGTPIEVGITGTNDFYYPLHNGAPLLTPQSSNYFPSTEHYLTNPHNNDFKHYLSTTSMFDYKQQFVSPGTAYGYGKKIDTDNAPFVNASETLSTLLSDVIAGVGSTNSVGLITSYLGAQNRMNPMEINNLDTNNFLTGLNTRYNPIYHSSLFTTLVRHNIFNAFNNEPSLLLHGGATPFESLTKLLFAGTFATQNPSSPFNVDTQNFKFVESGLPYVKFRIQSQVVDENNNPVATSDNQLGYIDYFVVMRVENHFNDDGSGDFQITNASGDVVSDLIDGYFNMAEFSKGIVPEYLFTLNQSEVLIPTIIADFRNPTYSISVEDASKEYPVPTNSLQDVLAFPLPGQHNPANQPGKAPNSGFHFYDAFGSGASGEAADEILRLINEYTEYQSSFLLQGAHPYFFTFDNLYMQDYDILGEFGQNPTYGFMQQKFYDADWVQDTYLALASIITELETNLQFDSDANTQALIKAKVMFNRLMRWNYARQNSTGTNGLGNWYSFYASSTYIQDGGTTGRHLNFEPTNPPFTENFQNLWDGLTGYINEGSTVNTTNPIQQHGSIYTLADAFSSPGLRMFGPPAPIGYVPRCGVNYRNYFGLQDTYETSEPPTLGNTNFVFNSGLDVGSIESLGTAFGFDTTQLLSNFNIENYSGDIDSLATRLFDRELWKLFYDVQLIISRLKPSFNQYTWGFMAPTHFVNEYYNGNINNLFSESISNEYEQELTPLEKNKFQFCYQLNLYTDLLDSQYNGIRPHYTYETITTFFGQQNVGVTEANVNPFSTFINPYIDESYEQLENSAHRQRIRQLLLQAPNNAGGIQNYEIGMWIEWLKSGCTQSFPTPHLPPEIGISEDSFFDVNQYGSFVAPSIQLIVPAEAENYVDVDINTNIPFTGNNWWQICDYLNQFEELKTGAINYITPIPPQGTESDMNDFLSGNVIQFSSTYDVGDGTIPSFYPANPSYAIPNNFFQEGTKIRIVFSTSYGAVPIYTAAFGPPPELGFASGTTFLQMINELVLDGIEGIQIDCYPYSGVDNNYGPVGNGLYTIEDGYEFLRITNELGSPDYRPLQLIGYALENNLMPVLYNFLPPTSSPDVSGDTIIDISEEDTSIVKFPLPPLAVGLFDNKNSAVSVTIGSMYYFRNEREVGFFSDGPGLSGMKENRFEDNGYQKKDHSILNGNEITTGSRNASNHPYFFPLVGQFENTNEFNAEEFFDVSWGHIRGEGSLKKHNGTSPSEAIYRQAANELIGNASGSFYSVSQSIKAHIDSDTEPTYMSDNPTPDEYVWILKAKQGKMQEKYGKLMSFPRIDLSGSNAAGDGVTISLRGGARKSIGATSEYVTINGLKRYYISDDLYNLTTSGVYGYWYPEIGTAVINSKITETITGGAGTTVTEFNKSGVAHNGMVPSGLTKTDKEYNNSLKLINCLKNKDTSSALSNFRYSKDEGLNLNILACIRLSANQFNFTTNPTRFNNLNLEDGLNTFNDSMKFDDVLGTSPTTYITHIDLYDNFGYRVATAKLSKPIKKDFNSEVVIKIMLKDY